MESILTDVSKMKTMRMVKNIVMEMVETAEKEGRTRRIFTDILHYGLTDQRSA